MPLVSAFHRILTCTHPPPTPPPCLQCACDVECLVTRIEQELALQHLRYKEQRGGMGAWHGVQAVRQSVGSRNTVGRQPTPTPSRARCGRAHQLGEAPHGVGIGRGVQGSRRRVLWLEGVLVQAVQQLAARLQCGGRVRGASNSSSSSG